MLISRSKELMRCDALSRSYVSNPNTPYVCAEEYVRLDENRVLSGAHSLAAEKQFWLYETDGFSHRSRLGTAAKKGADWGQIGRRAKQEGRDQRD